MLLGGILQCPRENEIRVVFLIQSLVWSGDSLILNFLGKDRAKNQLNLIMNLAMFSVVP